jgi:hypothetical protein
MSGAENMKDSSELKYPFIEQTKYQAGENGIFRRLPAVAIISIVIALGSAVWGISQSFVSYRIDENRTLITNHVFKSEQHMSLERKIQLFVLRREYEKDIKEIKSDVKSILEKLDKMEGKR